MRIEEVTTPAQRREFLMLPVQLYKNEKNWIRPLDKDIESVFDPAQNKFLKQGECMRWLLRNDSGEVIGRVAAFVNRKTVNKGNDQPTGGMGFFECIEDQNAAFLLFDQCKAWLQARGMEAMDGPINFGARDRWWGLLISGFDREPNYQCNYNFAYYQPFFEAYGFQVYFYQFTFARTVVGSLPPRVIEKMEITARNPDYESRHIRKDEIPKLGRYIHEVYNKAWSNRNENPEITLVQAEHMVKQMKPILDVRLLYFTFYKGEPVAFFLSLPEINQIFKHVNGKLDLLGKLKFLWHTWRGTNRKAFGILFGVVPEHQAKGLDGAMVEAARKVLQEKYKRYDEYELNWIGDFNPKMINVVKQLSVFEAKKHVTYRKLFDSSKPFRRAPILN
jgi:hypothetical protein